MISDHNHHSTTLNSTILGILVTRLYRVLTKQAASLTDRVSCCPDVCSVPVFQHLQGSSHYTDWRAGGPHPKSFTAANVTPNLVSYMRMGFGSGWATQELTGSQQKPVHAARAQLAAGAAKCRSADAIASSAESLFQPLRRRASDSARAAAAQLQQDRRTVQSRHPAAVVVERGPSDRQARLAESAAGRGSSAWQFDRAGAHHRSGQHWLEEAGYVPLSARCPLFARKFPAEVQQEVLAMALSCDGLGLGAGCS
jgi:hypothetical protein